MKSHYINKSDVFIKKITGLYHLISNANESCFYVHNNKTGINFILGLDDSKMTGNRKGYQLTKEQAIIEANTYINFLEGKAITKPGINWKKIKTKMVFLRAVNICGWMQLYKFAFDTEDDVIKIYNASTWETNAKMYQLRKSDKHFYSADFEIFVFAEHIKGEYPGIYETMLTFAPVIVNYSYDASTGFWNEKHLDAQPNITQAIAAIMDTEAERNYEYKMENDFERATRLK